MPERARPRYTTSKRALWLSGACAWLAIFVLIAGGLAGSAESVALAPLVIPSMVMLIVALLGVHRAFGSLDMHTLSRGGQPPRIDTAPAAEEERPA